MKHGLSFVLLLLSMNAFALYGEKVTTTRAAYVAKIESKNMKCAAVLIAPNKLLTAGHCIDVMGGELYGYSHALIYQPSLLEVKFGVRTYRALSVNLAPNYFDGIGYDTEDLALIELATNVTGITPIKFAAQSDFLKNMPVTLIANNKEVQSALISKTTYPETTVLWLDKGAGACRGDSGGAVVIQKNGEPRLAGILMFNGEGDCPRKSGYAYYPKAQF